MSAAAFIVASVPWLQCSALVQPSRSVLQDTPTRHPGRGRVEFPRTRTPGRRRHGPPMPPVRRVLPVIPHPGASPRVSGRMQ